MIIDRLEAQHLSEEFLRELDYRILMRVTAVPCLRLGEGLTTYPICPRCRRTVERENQSFCDRCGRRSMTLRAKCRSLTT